MATNRAEGVAYRDLLQAMRKALDVPSQQDPMLPTRVSAVRGALSAVLDDAESPDSAAETLRSLVEGL